MSDHTELVDPKSTPLSRRIIDEPSFDFRRLSDYGVLWLINRVVFHPRGFALALNYEDGNDEPVGWSIVGDGSEPWTFTDGIDDEKFAEIEGLLDQARRHGKAPHVGPPEEPCRG